MNSPNRPKPSDSVNVTVAEPLAGFLDHLQSYCVYGCCGMDAFNFEAAHTVGWIEQIGADSAGATLCQVRALRTSIAKAEFRLLKIDHPIEELTEEDLRDLLDQAEANLVCELGLCEQRGPRACVPPKDTSFNTPSADNYEH